MFLRVLQLVGALWVIAAGGAAAQALERTNDRPRFLFAGGAGQAAVEVSDAPVLRRRVTAAMNGVALGDALQEIGRQARIRFAMSRESVPVDKKVSLHAKGITLGAALFELLTGLGLDVQFSRDGGSAAIVRRGVGAQVGSVVGRVSDAKTGEALAGAEVYLDGTRWRATTAQDGRYRLAEVTPGTYTLAVRRVGYGKQSRAIAVAEGAEVTVEVALQPVATQLNEIVTTVTGEQRRVELGHVVGRINADSLVKEAPVASLSDLLNGRMPGLMVFQNQGTVGGQANLRIRGPNSLVLSPEPIIVVDGVRYTSTQRAMGASTTGGPGFVEGTSPLNDINVNDIESVEVVKGPSAATLYGSDAANGVLVITTKRGRPGPARWNAYGKGMITEIPTPNFPNPYWGWRTIGGVPSLISSCTLELVASRTCTQDSVTVLPNPLNDPALTIFDAKPRWAYGLNLTGGRPDLRYYFSGDLEDAAGPIQMPPALAERLRQQRGLSELPEEWREPNVFSKLNLRSNLTAALGERAELRFSSGYLQSSTRTLAVLGNPYVDGATVSTPAAPYGQRGDPASSFLQTSTEDVNRFYGSATGQWRVWPWLETRGTVGLDLTSSNRHSVARRGDAPNDAFSANGAVQEDQGRQAATTMELGATATARRGRLSWRTAAGVQYVRGWTNALFSSGRDLPPGGATVGQALTIQSSQTYTVNATLGSYLEETVGLNDRLFLTGALRLDGASTFGRDYQTALFPKLSASWLASEEPFVPRLPGLDELRLRYAFGAAGRQPLPRWGLPTFSGSQAIVDGAVTRTVRNFTLGNPNLRPEQVREHEFGFDASALGSRLRLGLTWFRRRTQGQLVNFDMPSGFGTNYLNLGLTSQRGFEAELTAQVLATHLLSWDVSLQHSAHTTYLRDLGGAPGSRRDPRGSYVAGYPLGARFLIPIVGYEDRDGNGIIANSELVRGDTAVYVGQSTPPESQTLTTVLGFFERRLRFSGLLERRAGFTQINPFSCPRRTCREAVDPNTSLADQALAFQRASPGVPEKGDFIRLREVTAAVVLPATLTRALRLGSATLAFSARNLALWTEFSGPDPESVRLGWGDIDPGIGATRGNVADGVPQGRSYTLRLDVGF